MARWTTFVQIPEVGIDLDAHWRVEPAGRMEVRFVNRTNGHVLHAALPWWERVAAELMSESIPCGDRHAA
jgi:hypothetical protein